MQDVVDRSGSHEDASQGCAGQPSPAAAKAKGAASATPEASNLAAAVAGSTQDTPAQSRHQPDQSQQQEPRQAAGSSDEHTSSKGACDDVMEYEPPSIMSPLKPRELAVGAQQAAADPSAQQQQKQQEQQQLPNKSPAASSADLPAQPRATGSAMAAADADAGPAEGLQEPTPEGGTSAAAAAPAAADPAAMRIEDEDDDDDDWEDQPAPLLPDDDDAAEPAGVAAAAEAASGEVAGDSLVGPSSRRREQYDDEDEWEELVVQQKTSQGELLHQHSACLHTNMHLHQKTGT
jgi:hypothetical protein